MEGDNLLDNAGWTKPSGQITTGKLIGWEDIDPWVKENPYILAHYRKRSNSYRRSIESIFEIHNETFNIWSHLLGALLFVYRLLQFLSQHPAPASTSSSTHASDTLLLVIYYVVVINCFALSSIYHIFSDHSRHMNNFGSQLDHLGIVIVMYGSSVAATYYEYYCYPRQQRLCWLISTGFAVCCAVVTLKPTFRQASYSQLRFFMHSGLGLSCFVSIALGLFELGYAEVEQNMSLSYFVALAICQFTGGLFYVGKIPERFSPGTFDVFGTGHQIMHVLVVIGALIYEAGLLKAFDRRNGVAAVGCST